MAHLESVRFVELALGLGLGLSVLLRLIATSGRLGSSRARLAPLTMPLALLVVTSLSRRVGVVPLAAMLVAVGLYAALTDRRWLTVVAFAAASLWLGPLWALLVFVVSPIAMAGVAKADRIDHRLPVWLVGASTVGAALAVPDVEVPTFFVAAFGLVALCTLGCRRRVAAVEHLVPFVLWGCAYAAQGRPSSIVGAIGGLGVLLVFPLVGMAGLPSVRAGRAGLWIVVHAAVAVLMARHAGLSTTWHHPLIVASLGLGVLTIVVAAVGRGSRPRSSLVGHHG